MTPDSWTPVVLFLQNVCYLTLNCKREDFASKNCLGKLKWSEKKSNYCQPPIRKVTNMFRLKNKERTRKNRNLLLKFICILWNWEWNLQIKKSSNCCILLNCSSTMGENYGVRTSRISVSAHMRDILFKCARTDSRRNFLHASEKVLLTLWAETGFPLIGLSKKLLQFKKNAMENNRDKSCQLLGFRKMFQIFLFFWKLTEDCPH